MTRYLVFSEPPSWARRGRCRRDIVPQPSSHTNSTPTGIECDTMAETQSLRKEFPHARESEAGIEDRHPTQAQSFAEVVRA